MVEFSPATREARVRFPASALFVFFFLTEMRKSSPNRRVASSHSIRSIIGCNRNVSSSAKGKGIVYKSSRVSVTVLSVYLLSWPVYCVLFLVVVWCVSSCY